jgi:chromosome segregation ATPase
MIIYVLIAAGISTLIFIAALVMLKKKAGGSISQDIETKTGEINSIIADTKESFEKASALGSKAQYESLVLKLEETKTNLAKEKENLKVIESKLVNVQRTVEEKEAHHQTMKTSKDEDDNKLTDLLANYENISNESVELEQKLAESMKNLDSILAAVPMNDIQKAMLQELSDTLTNAGSRMRDLLTEYNLVKERLDTLKLQHNDLEEEYTRLVEQQLGE